MPKLAINSLRLVLKQYIAQHFLAFSQGKQLLIEKKKERKKQNALDLINYTD